MQERSEKQERRTEEQVIVRQVTHLQASWAEDERGKPGAFTFQLILDQGVLVPAWRGIEDEVCAGHGSPSIEQRQRRGRE